MLILLWGFAHSFLITSLKKNGLKKKNKNIFVKNVVFSKVWIYRTKLLFHSWQRMQKSQGAYRWTEKCFSVIFTSVFLCKLCKLQWQQESSSLAGFFRWHWWNTKILWMMGKRRKKKKLFPDILNIRMQLLTVAKPKQPLDAALQGEQCSKWISCSRVLLCVAEKSGSCPARGSDAIPKAGWLRGHPSPCAACSQRDTILLSARVSALQIPC